ncbi:MAG: hypothetical protein IPM29_03580 [Planctomycetes bacterium]|nr:hypothetical protein [Planctomycetota bacterium]
MIRYRADGGSAALGGGSARVPTYGGVRADGEPVEVLLPTGADVALLRGPAGIELRCPLLGEPGIVALPDRQVVCHGDGSAAVEVPLGDVAPIDPSAAGPGRLVVAAAGTLLLVEHPGGVTAFEAGGRTRSPAGSRLRFDADAVRIVEPSGRLRTPLPAATADPSQRLRRVGPGRIELLGPRGDVLARLPESALTLHGGAGGLFLTARFPQGLPGAGREPFGLTAVDGNRYLLRVDF